MDGRNLQYLVDQVLSERFPSLTLFRPVAAAALSRQGGTKELASILRSRLTSLREKVSQTMLLELLEFCTCNCGTTFHNEIGSKNFLAAFHSLFGQQELSSEVRNKALALARFWEFSFQTKKDLYPNFSWYCSNVRAKGVVLPEKLGSPYVGAMKKPQSQTSLPPQTQAQVPPQTQVLSDGINIRVSQKQIDSSPVPSDANLSPKLKKLLSDLQVVSDQIRKFKQVSAQSGRNCSEAKSILTNLETFREKLAKLPEKLTSVQDTPIRKFVLNLISEIDESLDSENTKVLVQSQQGVRFDFIKSQANQNQWEDKSGQTVWPEERLSDKEKAQKLNLSQEGGLWGAISPVLHRSTVNAQENDTFGSFDQVFDKGKIKTVVAPKKQVQNEDVDLLGLDVPVKTPVQSSPRVSANEDLFLDFTQSAVFQNISETKPKVSSHDSFHNFDFTSSATNIQKIEPKSSEEFNFDIPTNNKQTIRNESDPFADMVDGFMKVL